MKLKYLLPLAMLAALASCSTTRSLKDGEYLLRRNKVEVNDKSFNATPLAAYMGQKPNTYFLGFNPFLSIYNWSQKDNKAGRILRQLGEAPVIYDPYLVDKTISNIESHLRHNGYYGSVVESHVVVKGRKVYVTYYIELGRRYRIRSIDYDIPSYGTFAQDFASGAGNIGLKPGQYLSEAALDQEASRSAAYMRTLGYYGFTNLFYTFDADTLKADGTAAVTVHINDYARGESPENGKPHTKYTLSSVSISRPEKLKLRNSVVENLNLLKPGQQYDEKLVNTTYNRFTSVNMLSGVNINMEPVGNDMVDCNIVLRNSGLQGFKTNLEASVNSTGLLGISPQLTYYHKNVFHGGELLNIGLKGNFQFTPNDPSAYSTEVSLSGNLKFPKAIGLPNRLFRGSYIPRTELSLAFSYQDRPEYRRTMISSGWAYSGRWNPRWTYMFTPIRANIVRMFDVDPAFMASTLVNNPFLLSVYSDHFDMGVSANLYYTTDPSAIPLNPYHFFRFGVDVSGNVISLFNKYLPVNTDGQHTIWETPYSQYIRFDFQAGKVFRFGNQDKQALALHFEAGAGYSYGNASSLPVEKLFYAGGAMSMRGWQARTLGPGTVQPYTEFAIPSQVGEMKMEVNAEYRFPLFSMIEGAAFIDVGNVWDISSDAAADAKFSIANLYKSLGANWGLGIRLNFDLILIRLDAGVKLHDPSLPEGQRWVGPNKWLHNNMAIHFGVGYPF